MTHRTVTPLWYEFGTGSPRGSDSDRPTHIALHIMDKDETSTTTVAFPLEDAELVSRVLATHVEQLKLATT